MATTHEPRICETCGTSFLPKYNVTAAYWATRRFCSHPCAYKGRRGEPSINRGRIKVPLEERFWAKVNKRGPDECWPWTGALQLSGYGYMLGGALSPKRWEIAHRVSWMVHFGEIPDGLVICHHCDNPPCVNPSHLFIGTKADNNQDRSNKGRGRENRPENRGASNAFAKLTEDQVRDIVARVSMGETQMAVAAQYGIKQPQVSRLVRRVSWAHLWEVE